MSVLHGTRGRRRRHRPRHRADPIDVIFLPGFSQTSSLWDDVAGLLSADTRRLDTPVGVSWEETVGRLAAAGGVGAYVGYSQGGRLACQIALDHPDLVHGLVMISAGPGLEEKEAGERRKRDEELAAFAENHMVDEFFNHWLALPLFAGRDPAKTRANRMEDPVAIAAQLRLLGQGIQPNLWPRLNEIEMPALLIVGEADEKYVGIGRAMATAIGANACLEVVAGAGHAVVETHPREVASLLTDFLDL